MSIFEALFHEIFNNDGYYSLFELLAVVLVMALAYHLWDIS